MSNPIFKCQHFPRVHNSGIFISNKYMCVCVGKNVCVHSHQPGLPENGLVSDKIASYLEYMGQKLCIHLLLCSLIYKYPHEFNSTSVKANFSWKMPYTNLSSGLVFTNVEPSDLAFLFLDIHIVSLHVLYVLN